MSADLADTSANLSTDLQDSRRVERRIIRGLLRRSAAHPAQTPGRRLVGPVALVAPAAALLALLLWPPELLWAALASALVVSLGLQ
jgi:hypothetical protein